MYLNELVLIRQMHQNNAYLSLLVFLDKNFKFEQYICNGCHDLMQKATNFNYVAVASIKGSDCRIHFWYTSEDDAINVMKNSNLNDKSGSS